MNPQELTYTLILENTTTNQQPLSINIQFSPLGTHHILNITNTITGKQPHLNLTPNMGLPPALTNQLDEAIKSFKWAVQNDPDEINPTIKKFISAL